MQDITRRCSVPDQLHDDDCSTPATMPSRCARWSMPCGHVPPLPLVHRRATTARCAPGAASARSAAREPARTTPGTTASAAASSWCRSRGTTSACSTRRRWRAARRAFIDDPNGCTYSEYGDRFDPMGGGCRHMNAWQKQYQGWFGGCNGVRVQPQRHVHAAAVRAAVQRRPVPADQDAEDAPVQPPGGGGGGAATDKLDWYYLELRTPLDFDGTLAQRDEHAVAARARARRGGSADTYADGHAHVPARHGPATRQPASTSRAGDGPDLQRSGRRLHDHRA